MGGKYHFNIQINSVENNAGSKAIDDCKKILNDNGYKNLDIYFVKKPYLIFYNLIKLLLILICQFFIIKKNSIIIVQYPLKGINTVFRYFIKMLHYKQCFVACIIHDIDSLRYKRSNVEIIKEIQILNAYNAVISHNCKMTAWLKANGLTSGTIDLEIFDYLYFGEKDSIQNNISDNNNSVVFAGSLGRGNFIYHLGKIAIGIKFKLYGSFINLKRIDSNENITWMGTFPPDKLIKELKGNFGLVWDGDSIDYCDGQMGEYLQYNNPHKASLYIAAGIPVIISSKAAIADFVLKNNIGIIINSIADIKDKLNSMSQDKYNVMLENTNSIAEKVRIGYFFNSALKKLEAIHFKILS